MKLIRFFFVLSVLICLVALHRQGPASSDEALNKARAALQSGIRGAHSGRMFILSGK